MNDEPSQETEKDSQEPQTPVWTHASLDDVCDLDFEAPIRESRSADCSELCELFHRTAQDSDNLGTERGRSAARVFAMLSSVTSLLSRFGDRRKPYSARAVWHDGRRTALPEDFRGAAANVLAHLAERAEHAALRARLCDVSWLVDRRRTDLAISAVAAYVDLIDKVSTRQLAFRSESAEPATSPTARDILRRALQIGASKSIGWDKPEVIKARERVVKLRKSVVNAESRVKVQWFSKLDLEFGVSSPLEVASDIEWVLSKQGQQRVGHESCALYQLAGHAYHEADRAEDKHRCQIAAAECLVAEAETALKKPGSAMLGATWLSNAIAQLHGIPGAKERRRELRHRLIDAQSGIPDEMSSHFFPVELGELIIQTEQKLGNLGLLDTLFVFADLERSPDPQKLKEEAQKSIADYPLSSLFATSYHDHEGKVIHRSSGGSIGNDENESALSAKIAQSEDARRTVVSFGEIEAGRRYIADRFYISDDVLVSLLEHSAFVPTHLVHTFGRGFSRFFEGDFISALYILTPLLENSLRHLLKLNGYDVTIFDDAEQTQQERTISSLFEQMRQELSQVFSPAITADIENVFLKRPGPCLRHGVAHGLLHDGTPHAADAIYACWLIFRLCCIPLFRHRKEIAIAG